MNKMSRNDITVNDRSYPFPGRTAVVICLDGCEPAYIDAAIEAGVMPTMKRIREKGTMHLAHCVIPTICRLRRASLLPCMVFVETSFSTPIRGKK